MKSPEVYLKELNIELACAVAPEAQAILNPEHRVFVNYETYFFSSRERRERFIAAPHEYTGLLTDPVSRERFQPGSDTATRTHGGKLFYFGSKTTRARFEAAPDSFSAPMLTMIAKDPPRN